MNSSTSYVFGIWSQDLILFECDSLDAAVKLRVCFSAEGVTPHPGLCLYTAEEWKLAQAYKS